MTITIGTWIIPTLITVVSVLYVYYKPPIATGYLGGIEKFWEMPLAGCVSLTSWLIWSLL